jgi:hypothetical protein
MQLTIDGKYKNEIMYLQSPVEFYTFNLHFVDLHGTIIVF